MASPAGSAAQGFMAGLTQMMDWHRQQAQFDQQMQLRKMELDQNKLQMEALNSYRDHQLQLQDREDQRQQAELGLRQQQEQTRAGEVKAGRQLDTAQLREQGVKDLGGLLGDLHRQKTEARSWGLDTSDLDRDIEQTRSRLDSLFGLPGAGKPPEPQDRPGGTPEGQPPAPMPSRLGDLMKEHGAEQTEPLVGTGNQDESALPPRMRGRASGKTPLEERADQERAATTIVHSQKVREEDLEGAAGGNVVDLTRNADVNDINLAFADPKHQVPVRITANESGTAWSWNRYQQGKAPQPITPDDIEEDPLIARDAAAGLMIAKRQGTLRPEIAESFESDVLLPTTEAYNRQLAALGKPIGMWGTFQDRKEKEATRTNEAGETVPVLTEMDLVMRPDVQKLMQIGDSLSTAKMAYGHATGKDMGEVDNPINRADASREANRFASILRLDPNLDPQAVHAGASYLLDRLEQEPSKDKAAMKALGEQLTTSPTGRMGQQTRPAPMDTMEPKEIERWKKVFDKAGVTRPGRLSGMAEPPRQGGGGGTGGLQGMVALASLGMQQGGETGAQPEDVPTAAENVTAANKIFNSIGPSTKEKQKAAEKALQDLKPEYANMTISERASVAKTWKAKRSTWKGHGIKEATLKDINEALGLDRNDGFE